MITSRVSYNWRPLENSIDEFGTDAANIIQFQFDVNEGMEASSEKMYGSFAVYFEENYHNITPALCKKIMNSARNIAESTRKFNKEELSILMKLRYLIAHGHVKKTSE